MESTAGNNKIRGQEGYDMRVKQGQPLPLGVTIMGDWINFSIAVPEGKKCRLLLYHAGETTSCAEYEPVSTQGEVRTIALNGMDPSEYEYNYKIDDVIVMDPFVKGLAGKETWGVEKDLQKHEIRGKICGCPYEWGGDRPLEIPYNEVVSYSLHVRGFTKHPTSGIDKKGTFAGVTEKIPYLQELGINQIQCMPIYEFEECGRYRNYWGYGDGFYFAPKSAYAFSGDGLTEFKDMIRACHQAGIEVVLEMPFTQNTSKLMIQECLRYYCMDYHVDGFILNPLNAPVEMLREDPVLKKTKLMVHDLGFQTVMRRFLKGDEGMVKDVMFCLRRNSGKEGIFNYITAQNGFTLNDLVSYDGKHNEMNGENNQDGPDYNYSWNCGAEGPTRKKAVLDLRSRQMKNAMLLVLLAQGTPCLLAGDEFCNTQKGNNNVYCQDNAIGWVDWGRLNKNQEFHDFVRDLIHLRKRFRVFYPDREMTGISCSNKGVPDVSYHGENAWRVPMEISSRQLGVYYCGDDEKGEPPCYVAYNMHWLGHAFALPALPKKMKWYRIASTDGGVQEEAAPLEDQRMLSLKERTIVVLTGRE